MNFNNELNNNTIAITVSTIGVIATIIGSYYGYKGSKNMKIAMYDKKYHIYSRTLELFKKSIGGDVLRSQETKEFIDLHNQSYMLFNENVIDFIGDLFQAIVTIDYINKIIDKYLIYRGFDINKILSDLCLNISEIEKSEDLKGMEEVEELLVVGEKIQKIEKERVSKDKIDEINLLIKYLFEKLNNYHINLKNDKIEEIRKSILSTSFESNELFNCDMESLVEKLEEFITVITGEYLPKYRCVFQCELDMR